VAQTTIRFKIYSRFQDFPKRQTCE